MNTNPYDWLHRAIGGKNDERTVKVQGHSRKPPTRKAPEGSQEEEMGESAAEERQERKAGRGDRG